MNYKMRATRKHPKLIIFLVDESTSMGLTYGGERKHVWVDRCINTAIRNLVWQCDEADGVRDWVHLAVIGYGGVDPNTPFVRSLLSTSAWILPISTIAETLIGKQDGLALYVESKPNGWTPMASAMKLAGTLASDWVEQHEDSPAPVILNVTDGVPTDDNAPDGPVEKWVEQLNGLATLDGPVLLMNAGVPDVDDQLARSIFPTSGELPAPELRYSAQVRRLWQLASPLPTELLQNAIESKLLPDGSSAEGRRMYVHVSDPADLGQLFDFGTQLGPDGPH
jgi:hypothetical protein